MAVRGIRVLVSVSVFAILGAILWAQGEQVEPSGAAMFRAAQKFQEGISPAQKAQAAFGYDDPERLNWHFIPRPRKGLPLKDLEGTLLRAAHDLIASGLSKSGYEQALNVMSLEEVLYLLEEGDRQERRVRRDPNNYYISLFGAPTQTGKWGWRLEGHHISLNYTIENGQVTASTPEFFGANPALINAGPGRAIRVLAPEEDLARQILKLCSPDQLKTTLIDPKAPGEVSSAAKLQPDVTPAVGLAAGKMNDDQKKVLGELLNEYLKNMPADVSTGRRERLMKAGIDQIHFAWWGGSDRNEPHHYRVQGPTFQIEYNNTQSNANHIHSMWRDMGGDFGIPMKK